MAETLAVTHELTHYGRMATCDPDGKIAEMVRDMHVCLSISLDESLRDAQERFDKAVAVIEHTHDASAPS